MVNLSKFAFNYKISSSVILLRVTPSNLNLTIYIYRERERELNLNNWLMTLLLIFDHHENLQAWKIYENNVI